MPVRVTGSRGSCSGDRGGYSSGICHDYDRDLRAALFGLLVGVVATFGFFALLAMALAMAFAMTLAMTLAMAVIMIFIMIFSMTCVMASSVASAMRSRPVTAAGKPAVEPLEGGVHAEHAEHARHAQHFEAHDRSSDHERLNHDVDRDSRYESEDVE